MARRHLQCAVSLFVVWPLNLSTTVLEETWPSEYQDLKWTICDVNKPISVRQNICFQLEQTWPSEVQESSWSVFSTTLSVKSSPLWSRIFQTSLTNIWKCPHPSPSGQNIFNKCCFPPHDTIGGRRWAFQFHFFLPIDRPGPLHWQALGSIF